MSKKDTLEKGIRKSYRLLIIISAIAVIAAIVAFYFGGPTEEIELPVFKNTDEVAEPGIDAKTGFVEDDGMQTVVNNCTTCHSSDLVTQNKMTKEGWLATIRWMQESQNLWDLGANEAIIVDYLAKNYAPDDTGRRAPLKDIEWYVLKE